VSEDIYQEYIGKSNLNIPLLTNDGIVIPEIGLKNALSKKEHVQDHSVYCWLKQG